MEGCRIGLVTHTVPSFIYAPDWCHQPLSYAEDSKLQLKIDPVIQFQHVAARISLQSFDASGQVCS